MEDQPAVQEFKVQNEFKDVDAVLAKIEALEEEARQEATTQPQEEQQAQQAGPCPRCGWQEGNISEPNEEDKKEFLRSILGGRPFEKKYVLWDGMITLTYKGLLGADTDRMNNLIMRPVGDNELEIRDYITKLKLLFFLSEIRLEANSMQFEPPTDLSPDKVLAVFNERFGQLQEPLIALCVRCMPLFDALQMHLLNTGLDENFWKGAGPV